MMKQLEAQLEMEQRHFRVLTAILEHQPIGIFRLSELIGRPKHEIRYSYQQLRDDGIIRPSPGGAVVEPDGRARISEVDDRLDALIGQIRALQNEPRLQSVSF